MKALIYKLSDGMINFAAGKRSSSKKEYEHLKGVLEKTGGTIHDADTKGFHVKRTGKKAICFRYYYRIHGKREMLTLGRFPNITTSQARDLVNQYALKVALGESPLQNKQEKYIERSNTLKSYLEHEYTLHMERAIDSKGYINIIKNHFPLLLKKPLADINKTDLTKWLQVQMKGYKAGTKGYARDSIRKRYFSLKRLMEHAVKNKVISTNPFNSMDKLEFHRDDTSEQQAKRTYLELEKINSLSQSIDNYDQLLRAKRRNSIAHGRTELPNLDNLAFASHHKPMFLILIYMGMRMGDVLTLKWENVIDTPFTCNITKVLEKTRRKVKDPFVLPMPPQVRDALKAWKKQTGNPKSGLVFINKDTKKRFDNKCLTRAWKWIKNDAALHEDLQLYTLRHNFVSWLIMNGTPLKVIAEMAGHKSTAMIEKHYGHLIKGATAQASNDFANLMESAGQQTDQKVS